MSKRSKNRKAEQLTWTSINAITRWADCQQIGKIFYWSELGTDTIRNVLERINEDKAALHAFAAWVMKPKKDE